MILADIFVIYHAIGYIISYTVLTRCSICVIIIGSLSSICHHLLQILALKLLMSYVLDGEEFFDVFVDASFV